MAEKITADVRETFGKGAARKLRAAGKIPAVLYGHGGEPQHVALPAHELGLIVRKANAVLEMELGGKTQLALVKDIQKDPVRQIIEHLDLISVRLGEKVQVEVPVHVEGESAPGTQMLLDTTTLLLEVEATDIPERVVIDVEGLEEGTQITAADVKLPAGASLISDPELLIVAISIPEEQDLGDSLSSGDAATGPAEESE